LKELVAIMTKHLAIFSLNWLPEMVNRGTLACALLLLLLRRLYRHRQEELAR
jgi:hypothetical protein